uniref:TraB/VirB10 family protein n=1 Tax=Methylomonas sp. PHL2-19 TaxID=3438878 RepID=UPI00402B29B0
MKNTLLEKWDALNPTYQRVIVVTTIVATLMVAISLMLGDAPPPVQNASKKDVARHIFTDADPRSLGIDGLGAQIRKLQEDQHAIRSLLDGVVAQNNQYQASDQQRIKQLADQTGQTAQTQIEALKAEIDRLKTENKAEPSGAQTVLPPDAGAKSHSAKERVTSADNLFNPRAYQDPAAMPVDPIASNPARDSERNALQIRVIKQTTSTDPETKKKVEVAETKKAEQESVLIPAGSILSGNLLNGMDAPTSSSAQKNPFPVLVRLKADAILPNRYTADVKECFVVSSGFGDLSSERAYIRAESISCVRQDGGVIEVPLDAYAVGEDGKVGIRGRFVSKQGALLRNALLAGFLRGFSDMFGRTQTQVLALAGPAGVATTPFQRSFSQDSIEGGALRGTGYAMERLANYYIDYAENLFPVIEIDVTRKINLVVQRGTKLRLLEKS